MASSGLKSSTLGLSILRIRISLRVSLLSLVRLHVLITFNCEKVVSQETLVGGIEMRMPASRKQATIVVSVHDRFTQCMASSTFISFVREILSSHMSILAIRCFNICFLYLALKARIIPRSNGWSLEVVFGGKKRNVTLLNFKELE